MRKKTPLYTEMHLSSYRYVMALPRSRKDHVHWPCNPFLPTSDTAGQRARRILRDTGASNLLRVSHRAAGIARKGPWVLRTDRINSARFRLAWRRHKPHASSFALKRRVLWIGSFTGISTGRIEAQRGGCPLARPYTCYCSLMAKPGPAMHMLLQSWGKPLYLHVARLTILWLSRFAFM